MTLFNDTLWETMPLYTEAKGRFYDLMAAVGFDRGAAEERFEAIDPAKRPSAGELLPAWHGLFFDTAEQRSALEGRVF